MKMIKKTELEYKDGYLVKDGDEIIGIDNKIVAMFNSLERQIQVADYKAAQPKIEPGDYTLENFEFKSERVHAYVDIDTPALDKKIQESLDVMNDLDNLDIRRKVNDWLEANSKLVEFCTNDYVIAIDCVPMQFDLPTIGNPLEFTAEKLASAVIDMFCEE